jgi:stage III sporulation protein AB
LSLGNSLGSYDIENQSNCLKLVDSQLDLQQRNLEVLISKNGKMYKNLGVLGGIAICIMLI